MCAASRGDASGPSLPFRRPLCAAAMSANAALLFLPVGDNAARAFGIDARERACRLATNAGFECVDEVREGAAALVASLGYAWDPVWLRVMRGRPRTVL